MTEPKADMSKSNSLEVDPLQRLSSLKPPRDLSLGAKPPSKKIFVPNLNVTRNKNKIQATSAGRESKNNDKDRRDHRNNKHKFVKNGPQIIKTSGVFSDGMAATERHSTRASSSRSTESPQTLQKPTIRVKDVVRIDKELEEERLKAMLEEDPNADDCEDFTQRRDSDAPIKLPLDGGGRLLGQRKPPEVIIKKEPGEEDSENPIPEANKNSVPQNKHDVFEDTDIVDLLTNDKPTLLMIKLPYTLPGRGSGQSNPRRRNMGEPSTSSSMSQEEQPQQDDNRCRLSDLEEGCLGKLLVYRSGRVTLSLGDTVFEVCLGTKPAFHQEVVSVNTDDNSRSANLIALGPLEHTLMLVPDWKTLFRNMKLSS